MGTPVYFQKGGCQVFILCDGFQNTKRFPPELGGFGNILRLSMITRSRPGLIHMEDAPLFGNLNPQKMIK